MTDDFQTFWTLKPKRKGSNPKFVARKSFEKLVRSGVDPSLIIQGVRQWANQEKENKKLDTEFVPMAVTWLNQRRFEDYEDQTEYAPMFPAVPGSEKFEAWKKYFDSAGKKSMVSLLRQRELEGRPWSFESEWPPNYAGEME